MLLGLAHILGARRGADDLAAGLNIGISENDMAMRIMLILALVVKGTEPRDPALPDFLHESRHRLVPLLFAELDRQSDDQRIGDPRIRRHPLLVGLTLEIGAGALAVRRHV